jgi:DNA polymerase elongation subunit (family B)
MAYDAKVNFTDVFYQVRTWDSIIYNYLKKRNIVIPPKKSVEKNDKYAGAYVKEPKPGSYDWVVSFDLNSLYPHLIMQYNISPETLRETVRELSSRRRCFKQSRSMKIIPLTNSLKRLPDVITFRWQRRYNLIVLMVLSVTITSGIIS